MSNIKTMYMCVYWDYDGSVHSLTPIEEIKYAQYWATNIKRRGYTTIIYKFDVDIS